MNKKRFYELRELREGIPLHAAERYLSRYLVRKTVLLNREGICSLVMRYAFLDAEGEPEKVAWRRSFEIAINVLQGAAHQRAELIKAVHDDVASSLTDIQANIALHYSILKDIESKQLPEREAFNRLLTFYAELYDGLYKVMVTLFVISKMVLNNQALPENLRDYTHCDSKEKIKSLADDSGEVVPAVPELCDGCERHLRNAIAHKRWRKIGRGKIVMWDEYASKETWRKTFTTESLQKQVETLLRTCEAMEMAFMIYSENLYCAENRGALSIPPGQYDDEAIRRMLESVAVDMQMFCEVDQYDEKDDSVTVTLYILENLTIPQTEQIIEGSTPPRFFDVPVTVVEDEAVNQVLNFLIMVGGPLQTYSKVRLVVVDEKAGELGRYELSRAEIVEFYEGKVTNMEDKLGPLKGYKLKLTVRGPKIRV